MRLRRDKAHLPHLLHHAQSHSWRCEQVSLQPDAERSAAADVRQVAEVGEGQYGAERDQHYQPTVRLTGHLYADASADSAYIFTSFTQDMISSPGSARPHSDSAN